MKKTIINIMMITILAKILGFARELLLSYFFGATGISDAYLISLTIPGTIFQFVGTGLATCFIPIYLRILNKEGKNKSNQFTNGVISLVLLFSSFVIILVNLFDQNVVKLFASGFTGTTLEYAIFFTKINIFSLYISTLIYVYTSYLQAHELFTVIAFAAIPNSIMIMITIVLGAKVNIIWLPIGSILAVLVQLFVMLPKVKETKFRLRPNFKFRTDYMKEMYKLTGPVTLGVSINEINVLIDKTVASRISVGGISALTYANSLIMFVQGIFAQSIATVYYPSIARMVERDEEQSLKNSVEEALKGMLFLLLPIAIGSIILSEIIVKILYGRGAFDNNAISLTSTALALYAIGILGYGFREMLSRVFYAFHDTKTPTINAILGMLLNIIMNLTLSRMIGIGGLALATSLSSTLTSILLIIKLNKKIGKIFGKKSIKTITKIIAASLIMGGIILFLYSYMDGVNIYIKTIILIGTGSIVYVIISIIFRIDVLMDILNRWRKRQEI